MNSKASYVSGMALIQPCPPHHWSHAPTVGYFRCGKCEERVWHSDPRYAQILATLSPPLPSEVERLREALEHALDFINGDVGPEFRDFTRDEVTAALSALPLDGGL